MRLRPVLREKEMFSAKCRGGLFGCRRGEMVEVRSKSEIMDTLDADGMLEGLPFMPEMAKHCGRRFRIYRRAEKVFLDYHYYIARMKAAVFLEGARCDGASHDGCQMGCLMFWKEAWLKGVESSGETGHRGAQQADRWDVDASSSGGTELPTSNNGRFCCQATELVRATTRLPWWDVRQYLRDLVSREMTLGQFVRMFGLLAYNKVRRVLGRRPYGFLAGEHKQTSARGLGLRPGEFVEVRSRAEIEATLDSEGKNRGLGFTPEMAQFCGKRYRVASRADKIILEWSGEMCRMSNTVILEGVVCQGIAMRGCPRDCYQLWRETWLKRVS